MKLNLSQEIRVARELWGVEKRSKQSKSRNVQIFNLISKRNGITNQEIIKHTSLTKQNVSFVLQSLARDGRIIRTNRRNYTPSFVQYSEDILRCFEMMVEETI